MPTQTLKKSPRRMLRASTAPSGDSLAPEPDLDAAFTLVMELMAIPGRSGEETAIIDFIRRRLLKAGAPADGMALDETPAHSPIGGKTGGLILQLPGTLRAPRRLLMAHVDTVPLCVGARPVKKGSYVRSADKMTGLGADDRAGAAVVLTSALEILRRGLPHPPLTFFWPVQEEVGLYGARNVALNLLGKPKLAFNWDGGDADKLTIGATGAYRMQIVIEGLASHAGGAPEMGVSAIAIAGRAIASLHENGWHGDVNKDGRHGTSNIGVIQGGEATNVVTDRVAIRAEARSHDRRFRREILRTIEQAFQKAAAEVKNVAGRRGKVRFASRLDYESFRLADDEPCVLAAEAALAGIGREPYRAVTNGGLDANWLTARGIPTVTLGCGQMFPHTVREQLDIAAFRSACRVGLRLATASEKGG
jgi:tripeptide aminopeptidase